MTLVNHSADLFVVNYSITIQSQLNVSRQCCAGEFTPAEAVHDVSPSRGVGVVLRLVTQPQWEEAVDTNKPSSVSVPSSPPTGVVPPSGSLLQVSKCPNCVTAYLNAVFLL